jgi:predicted anti-sigma-YlaC factor YlaD
MKCKHTRKVLSRYLDHELSSTETVSVEEHLAQCSECRTEHATQQRLWTLIGRAEPVRSPDLMAAVEARLSERRGWASFLAGLRLRSFAYATATAALVGLFAWTGVWAGTARHGSYAREHDRTFAELLSDVPPGMEVVAVLDQIGERP